MNGQIIAKGVENGGANGVFSGSYGQTWAYSHADAHVTDFFTTVIDFKASNSKSIYGTSETVQPPALTARYYIKF